MRFGSTSLRFASQSWMASASAVSAACQHRCVAHLPGHFLRVAAEVDDETVALASLSRAPKPAMQTRTVVRLDSDLGGAGQKLDFVPIAVRERRAQKDELLLKQVEHHAQPDEYREPGVQQRQHGPLDQLTVLVAHLGLSGPARPEAFAVVRS